MSTGRRQWPIRFAHLGARQGSRPSTPARRQPHVGGARERKMGVYQSWGPRGQSLFPLFAQQLQSRRERIFFAWVEPWAPSFFTRFAASSSAVTTTMTSHSNDSAATPNTPEHEKFTEHKMEHIPTHDKVPGHDNYYEENGLRTAGDGQDHEHEGPVSLYCLRFLPYGAGVIFPSTEF
ncbi:hypothetical protein BCR34DRAFT_296612 [Clohesyomyces aquaticus]|uniref:Uncharacterized protein n=1 Tax=Clohesyomyces aquaticus TaxID=1231657 RepID=A0A1Y2A978_9PLEO|nr:hypothetical protein BCR34DRAFT_296612 [Clohesyomyces aquaticus]